MSQNRLSFFIRKKRSGAYSIEELSQSLLNSFPKEFNYIKCELPLGGASIKSILHNIWFARRNRNEINHVSGEVNYIALGSGRNTVLTIHDVNSTFQMPSMIKKVIIYILWYFIPSLIVKRITVISNFSKNELTKLIPWAKHKIVVVPNSINQYLLSAKIVSQKAELQGRSFKLLQIGTKSNKNLERVVEAIKGLKIELTIIGVLSEKQIQCLKEGLIDFKTFSNLSYDEVIEKYQETDAVCFVSTYEGFGMPIIEAQALNKPLITSNIGAMKEVSNGSALEVNPYKVDEIRAGIIQLMNNDDLKSIILEKGKENILRFYPKTIRDQYMAIYEDLLN